MLSMLFQELHQPAPALSFHILDDIPFESPVTPNQVL